MSFEGKVVIVTGAGGGIGEGYAKRFAKEGMKVCIAEIAEEGGMRVAAEINADGGEAIFVKVDVSDEKSCFDCANSVVEKWNQIDYLINNAAIFGGMRLDGLITMDLDYFNKFMAINGNGCLLMTRACVEHMPKGSCIVNQSSTAAWMHSGPYGVSKMLVNAMTTSLANELGWRRIRVNAIAPGPTQTEALTNTIGDDGVKEMVKTFPLRRVGTTDDMANAIMFLLSDQASWITGVILNVDGGQLMRT